MISSALMQRLQHWFERHPELKGTPALAEQIAEAEQQLGITLDAEYVQFISAFGGAYAGIAVHAFANASSLGKETLLDLTLDARRWILADVGMVFSDDGSGNPIHINANGAVMLFDMDAQTCTLMASSFSVLLEDVFQEW